jgi:hypothetical protein
VEREREARRGRHLGLEKGACEEAVRDSRLGSALRSTSIPHCRAAATTMVSLPMVEAHHADALLSMAFVEPSQSCRDKTEDAKWEPHGIRKIQENTGHYGKKAKSVKVVLVRERSRNTQAKTN